ncbi:hypothetical protein EG68_08946 [Paragonimus skrjabini miyazakii]|uniref:Uncharacterized protein n=1 Tax=Paragonimus skrjabini miyazakii TaxID=59628 RepID=A0A8S9YML4_9TREM|nr:hypothetical protein EG68_08946 [Paragonimus skrjabini miyazakii]
MNESVNEDPALPAESSISDDLRKAFLQLGASLAWRSVILDVVRKCHPEIPKDPRTILHAQICRRLWEVSAGLIQHNSFHDTPDDTWMPCFRKLKIHAPFEEAWSHIREVDLDDSLRTVPMMAPSSLQKVLGTILNPTSSTSSKTTVPPLVDTDKDKSFGHVNSQTALLHRLSQDVHLLLLKVDMLEKLMRSKSGVHRSPDDNTKSLTCLPFMAPYRTLTDFDTGEVILTSEKKENSGTV